MSMEGEITSLIQKEQELAYKYFKMAKDELEDRIDQILDATDFVKDRCYKGPIIWGNLDQIGNDMAIEVAADAGFDKEHQNYLSIVIIEILTNAMESIEKGGFTNEIIIQYDYVTGKYVRFYIESPGAADLALIKPCLPDHNLECIGGRGTLICYDFLDAIDYYAGKAIINEKNEEFTAVSGAMFVKVAEEYSRAS